jgi:hypothetical protein
MTGIEADLAVAVDEWTNATCPMTVFSRSFFMVHHR